MVILGAMATVRLIAHLGKPLRIIVMVVEHGQTCEMEDKTEAVQMLISEVSIDLIYRGT